LNTRKGRPFTRFRGLSTGVPSLFKTGLTRAEKRTVVADEPPRTGVNETETETTGAACLGGLAADRPVASLRAGIDEYSDVGEVDGVVAGSLMFLLMPARTRPGWLPNSFSNLFSIFERTADDSRSMAGCGARAWHFGGPGRSPVRRWPGGSNATQRHPARADRRLAPEAWRERAVNQHTEVTRTRPSPARQEPGSRSSRGIHRVTLSGCGCRDEPNARCPPLARRSAC
jgi:hypothetical protein